MSEKTGLERLREFALACKGGNGMRCNYLDVHYGTQSCGKRLCGDCLHGLLADIADQIEREHLREVDDISGYESDVLGFVESQGGLDALKSRLMPEGMEWPRTEAGVPVKLGDQLIDDDELEGWREVDTIIFQRAEDGYTVEIENDRGVSQLYRPGERVKHPERKGSRLDGCCPCGSYKCDEFAFYDQDRGKDVFADKCLVPELRKLRESGIRTIASCCGHGTMRPNIVVAPECEDEMRRQGYEGRCNKFGVFEFTAKSECPAPKVLDADGVEIRVGKMVYSVENGAEFTVIAVDAGSADVHVRWGYDFEDKTGTIATKLLTHRAPVLAADEKPLREGEHVWHVETGTELVVKKLPMPGEYQAVVVFAPHASHLTSFDPDQLTHERPVADSWERLEEDCKLSPIDYCRKREIAADGATRFHAMQRDLVRRAKALAGVIE